MTVSYEEAVREATDYLAEADLHLARTGRLPSIPLPADLLRALLAGPPEPMALSASDASCYAYPGEDQGPLRDAFVQGALSVRAGPPEPSEEEVVFEIMTDPAYLAEVRDEQQTWLAEHIVQIIQKARRA